MSVFNTISDRRRLKNSEWVRQSFMISHSIGIDTRPDDDEVKLRARFFTTARFKYTDTTIGGNMVINPLPQFTRSADLRVGSLYRGSRGMGRGYSEYIDDNKRIVTMCFGVPQFNSLSSFFQSFYDSQASSLARTGRSTGLFYLVGRAVGFVISITSIPLMLFSLGGAAFRYALAKPSSRFFYFKPTMAVYWNAVTAMVNDIAVKQGIISRAVGNMYPAQGDYRDILSESEMRELNAMIPDVIDSYDADSGSGNGINMYAVATRAQRLARRAYTSMKDYYIHNNPDWNTIDAAQEWNRVQNQLEKDLNAAARPKMSFTDYVRRWIGAGGDVGSGSGESAEKEQSWDADLVNEKMLKKDDPRAYNWTEFLKAELDDGAQYVAFRVENGGPVNESFSSQVGESALAGKINDMSGAARSTRNDMAQGNLDDGMIGTVVGGMLQAAGNFATGVADSVGLGGLAILGGNAFVDIPRSWQNSSANLPKMNYTIKLRSPYGNRFSRLTSLYIPLAMILVPSLALSTGRHSYTSPFLCNLFDRGRAQTRLGIITNLSVTRGTTNTPFNEIGEALGIDVSFTVEELSSIMHMSISQGFGFMDAIRSFDDETTYHDYIASLTALSLHEQVYTGEKFKLAVTRIWKNIDSYFSVPHATNFIGDLGIGRIASIFYDGIANR